MFFVLNCFILYKCNDVCVHDVNVFLSIFPIQLFISWILSYLYIFSLRECKIVHFFFFFFLLYSCFYPAYQWINLLFRFFLVKHFALFMYFIVWNVVFNPYFLLMFHLLWFILHKCWDVLNMFVFQFFFPYLTTFPFSSYQIFSW